MKRAAIARGLIRTNKRERSTYEARPIAYHPPVFSARHAHGRIPRHARGPWIAVYAETGTPFMVPDSTNAWQYNRSIAAHYHASPEDAIAWANMMVAEYRAEAAQQ